MKISVFFLLIFSFDAVLFTTADKLNSVSNNLINLSCHCHSDIIEFSVNSVYVVW